MNTMFTVDTHVFRELGALLVGRDSTALVELIKNAYDADATEVTVYGEQLHEPDKGYIRITDTGNGMTKVQFETGFLRIASRMKEQGERRSPRFQRRYTGAKGIGRLAVHKLARIVEVESIPWLNEKTAPVILRDSVEAKINWDLVESCETLDKVGPSAIQISSKSIPRDVKSGTTITLKKLRKRWTDAERSRFMAEMQAFESPRFLYEKLTSAICKAPLLFENLRVRDKANNTEDVFKIVLDGEFAVGESFWQPVIESATWVIEVDASRTQNGKVLFAIAPSGKLLRMYPWIETRTFVRDHPDPKQGPFFAARILVREGQLNHKVRTSAEQAAGIRVYMEGFRVLPYGEPQNDWLAIDTDVAANATTLPRLNQENELSRQIDKAKDEGQTLLPTKHYYGSVFLTQADAPDLQMVVNREGFVPGKSFEVLTRLVRNAVDLATRVRAAIRHDPRYKQQTGLINEPADGPSTGKPKQKHKESLSEQAISQVKETGQRIALLAREANEQASKGNIQTASEIISEAERTAQELSRQTRIAEERFKEHEQRAITESAMLRVLASIGTQMAAFIHEINTLLSMAQSVENAANTLRSQKDLPREIKLGVNRLISLIGDLRRNIEKQASYLIDVVTPDARRRRARLSLFEKFEAGRKLIEPMARRRNISIDNQIPIDLKSPPMFPAELTTVFSNLLTNAVKAAGEGGRITARGERRSDGYVLISVENTGTAIDLKNAERWFLPFESTTAEVNPSLGQGMGLGLTITRAMLEEYGAEIKFVEPSAGFATAIELAFPQ